MLEDVLDELIRQHTDSEALREAILDGYQGVDRRRDLFRRLGGISLGKLLTEDWGQEFLRDWRTLAERRNKVAHGSYYYRGSEDGALLSRVQINLLRAFAEMENYVTRRTAKKNTPPEPGAEAPGIAPEQSRLSRSPFRSLLKKRAVCRLRRNHWP
jgi:hypothetical protein